MLWKEAILEKYGMEHNWITKNVTTPYGCSIWRAIRNLWPKMQIRTKVRIGNGQKNSFWHDKWAGFLTIKEHPEIYTLSQQQEVTSHSCHDADKDGIYI